MIRFFNILSFIPTTYKNILCLQYACLLGCIFYVLHVCVIQSTTNRIKAGLQFGSLPTLSFKNSSAPDIRSIHILGERNSGTTWIYEHLGTCFNHTIPVRRRLKRYKHWFQDESLPSGSIIDGALVITMFRNPLDWTEAMRKKPHHAPNHLNLTWYEFVTTPWTMNRVFADLNVTYTQKQDIHFCQEYFFYDDVVTCHQRPYPPGYFVKSRFSQHQPFYEMRNDGSGKPFSSILQLRAAKIHNFLSTKDYHGVKELWVVPYEQLLRDGTWALIHRLERVTGVHAQCQPSPSQIRHKRNLEYEMVGYILSHVDWDAEKRIGYYRDGDAIGFDF